MKEAAITQSPHVHDPYRVLSDEERRAQYRTRIDASLVVDHRVVFEQLKARMSELKIQDEISIIFIDHRSGRILDEYVAPLSDGRIPQFMFCRIPTSED